MGMPGFSGFIAEFPIFMGLWQAQPIAALVVVISIVVTAAYILRVIGRVFFGALPVEFEGQVGDVIFQDKLALVVLAGILVLVGVYPAVMAPMVQNGADAILRLIGAGS
jgi:NADH-quinone oxidoreductase subunit M